MASKKNRFNRLPNEDEVEQANFEFNTKNNWWTMRMLRTDDTVS